MATRQIQKPSNLSGHILGEVWEDTQSNNFATDYRPDCFSLNISPLEGIRYWSCPRQLSHSEHWSSDRQGSLGVSEWGNCVLWDVRVQRQGALRQCRSGFRFGYRQKCCSCIKGCCNDRGSCDFLCSTEVPGVPSSLLTKTLVFSQLLSVIRSAKVFAHTSKICWPKHNIA